MDRLYGWFAGWSWSIIYADGLVAACCSVVVQRQRLHGWFVRGWSCLSHSGILGVGFCVALASIVSRWISVHTAVGAVGFCVAAAWMVLASPGNFADGLVAAGCWFLWIV